MHDNDIKRLIKILEESKIDELEVSTFWGRQKIRLRKSIAVNNHDIHVKNNRLNQIDEEENRISIQKSNFKNSDFIMKNGLLIGCHQGLSMKNISYIHSTILNFTNKNF